MWDTLVRPSAERAATLRASGRWRNETILDDLWRVAQADPDKIATVSYAAGSLARVLSYRELAALGDRFAAALLELGVRRGEVVAIHLPNWWMVNPLYLACARIGAVPAPVVPALSAPGNSARSWLAARRRCASWPTPSTTWTTSNASRTPRRRP